MSRYTSNPLTEKYSVAWFRISEYISRGERERALGLYKLLAHSISDTALIQQVEGDIFLSFNDSSKAIECYKQAAHYYTISKRFSHAIGMYEQIISLDPQNTEYIHLLYTTALTHQYSASIEYASNALIKNASHKAEYVKTLEFIITCITLNSHAYTTARILFCAWIAQTTYCPEHTAFCSRLITLLSTHACDQLKEFLAALAPINKALYDQSIAQLSAQ